MIFLLDQKGTEVPSSKYADVLTPIFHLSLRVKLLTFPLVCHLQTSLKFHSLLLLYLELGSFSLTSSFPEVPDLMTFLQKELKVQSMCPVRFCSSYSAIPLLQDLSQHIGSHVKSSLFTNWAVDQILQITEPFP